MARQLHLDDYGVGRRPNFNPCIPLDSAIELDHRCALGTLGCTEAHPRGAERWWRTTGERSAAAVRERRPSITLEPVANRPLFPNESIKKYAARRNRARGLGMSREEARARVDKLVAEKKQREGHWWRRLWRRFT